MKLTKTQKQQVKQVTKATGMTLAEIGQEIVHNWDSDLVELFNIPSFVEELAIEEMKKEKAKKERQAFLSSLVNELNIVGNDMRVVKKHAESLIDQKNPSPSRMFLADQRLNNLIVAFEALMKQIKHEARFIIKGELFDFVRSCGVTVYKSWNKQKMVQSIFDTKVAYINS